MKIAVIGATGGTGQELVSQALSLGHSVSILTRTIPPKGINSDPKLQIHHGSSRIKSDLLKCFKDSDLVISALGSRNGSDVCSKSQPLINEAMKELGLKKIVVVTSLGCRDSYKDISVFTWVITKLFLQKVIEDKNLQEESLVNSDLNWTIVRPGGLNDKPLKGEYKYAESGIGGGMTSRADVAHFILHRIVDGPDVIDSSKKAFTVVS
jgi:uncharacterized protein YbjT (DUF2867 family)